MNDPNPEVTAQLHALEDRLQGRISRLERAQRGRAWLTGALLVGLAGSLALSGAIIFDPSLVRGLTSLDSEVRANRFLLEDGDGNVRGSWELAEDGAVRLSIRDAEGRSRLNLAVLEDGAPGISLADEQDQRRVVVGLLPDRTSTLVFADATGVPRAVLGVSGQGSSSLVFADGGGVSRVALGLDASGVAGLTLPEVVEESETDDAG
jgi:hypothetical protein